MLIASQYSRAWPCLLPQHGPGVKHERPIVLTDWQQSIVDARPDQLVRGLLHSDGWRGVNRVIVNGKAYEYGRFQFSNRSDDIRALFCDALDRLGIPWRRMNRWNISVARRDGVAMLDHFVEPKD
ncbi:MAG: transcriptional regulator [Conexibacter sp.]|nr:transcriptional regulator [Conexibacter sp.]